MRDRVVAHLVTEYADHFVRTGTLVRSVATGTEIDLREPSIEPLLQLSQVIEEDFMLLEEIDGDLRITAASNAYSNSGRLVASVGRDMSFAHEPVPALNDKLGSKISGVLASVHTATPCERFNWPLTPLSTIFFPHDNPHAANAAAMHEITDAVRQNPDRVGDLLWIRVERQTLSRLPKSNAVAFSLHSFSDPLAALQTDMDSVRAVLALLQAYSAARWRYAEMDIVRDPVLRWLESIANAAE